MDRRWSIDQPATPPRTAEQPVGTGSVAMRIGERPHTTVESINEEEDARPLMLAPDSEAVLVNEGTMPDPNSDPMLRVLRKPPDLRTEEDLIVVANATKTVKFFRQMGDAALHRELCRHMTLEQVPKESVIFQQGDEGSTFYIIYTGAVKVRGATHLYSLHFTAPMTHARRLIVSCAGPGRGRESARQPAGWWDSSGKPTRREARSWRGRLRA